VRIKTIKNKQNLFNHYLENKCLLNLMNTGNFVINKYLIDNINISNDIEIINKSSACDVILFNTLLLEQFNIDIHVIENMNYLHIVHPDSTYLKTSSNYPQINKYVTNRFISYIKNITK
jgi:ATP-dependent phosphoenolpyruvate carboxykinase